MKMKMINPKMSLDTIKSYIEVWNCKGCLPDGGTQHNVMAVDDLSCLPTIEAEPVRHGQWVAVSCFEACGGDEEVWMAHGNPTAYHYCSECKNETYLNEEGKEILSDYCPFCGADMKEVSEDETD